MNDKVALITPSFNRAYIIEETAESIFAQTHHNWEWVIVDDGSTDESWDLIQSFAQKDHRVKALQRDRGPKGACTCRNIAVDNTDAEWLIFLDTDDLLHPDCLRQRLVAAQSASDLEVLYFPILVFEKSLDECYLWDDPNHPTEWLEGVLTMTPPVQGSGTFWPKKLWESHGGWREDLGVWQDIELHARAHWEGVRFSPASGASPDFYLRVSPDSLSRVGFHTREKLESRLVVIHECWNTIHQKGGTDTDRKALAEMTISAIRNAANLRMFKEIDLLIQHAKKGLTANETELARHITSIRKFKLDRIPFVRKRVEKRCSQIFPKRQRMLGKTRWIESSE